MNSYPLADSAGRPYKIPLSVLVVIHTPALEVLLIRRVPTIPVSGSRSPAAKTVRMNHYLKPVSARFGKKPVLRFRATS